MRAALASKSDETGRLALDPETVEQDLARLVLGIVAFLRELMELQAIRRSEAGSLTPEEEERVGLTLHRAEHAIHEMAGKFGLTPEELSLDLGPLGRTI
ncbi:MAG: gas vesicle protein K [Pseudomonadota bacterium]